MRRLDSIRDIAGDFDAIVFDQWGVLHNGSTAYPGAIAAVESLAREGVRLAVLSNSGKRSAPNRKRIASMGFPAEAFATVMTSGEALWLDLATGRFPGIQRLFAITAAPGDAQAWSEGLVGISITTEIAGADAILLMGLPDEPAGDDALHPILVTARKNGLPMFCSNPDKASPRQGGRLLRSPGALAEAYAQAGGQVFLYGKPHRAVFDGLQRALGISDPARILMIGDSLEHDVAGAAAVGWKTLFIEGGLHAADLAGGTDFDRAIADLCLRHDCGRPDFLMEHVAP
ncbi:MAG: TIGR01459 family HAD-type hydrolase [Methylobacterium sp.]|nr:TIGR01459 family HAD-type hydrolase [Methylobacterium sp.]